MNTDKVNRWLTLGANFGVVAGLILLIMEINQNSALVRAQIHQARSDNYVATSMEMADSEFLMPAFQKFTVAGSWHEPSALDALDPIEAARVRRYAQARLAEYDNLFYQHQQGYLDEEFYQSRVVGSIERIAPFWIVNGMLGGITPGFRAEIERVMSGGK